MIVGVIKTKDVLLHPITIIHMKGLKGFFKILKRAISTKTYRFVNFMENTAITMISKKYSLRHK